MTRWVARMLLPAALLLGGAGCAEPMIEVAKDKVYPALVFVKPIRETFEAGERQRAEVFGSGVIISADGLVVTNHHVAEKAIEVNCVLGDREQVLATVVGLDPETDLALLKLDLPPGHPPLTVACFGDSDVVEPGQPVLALGSPFGFTRSISQGIISNTKRYIGFTTQYQYNLWLQTDAAINPGNSGGPLVNVRGEVIGINTLGTWAEGVGFAIPSNVVRDVVSRLLDAAARSGCDAWPVKVQRAYVGLQLQALKDFNTNSFTDSQTGVLVQSVDQGSPAEQAGVRDGDILLAVARDGGPGVLTREARVDGTYVEDLPAIRRMLADLPTDRPAKFLLARRNGEPSNAGAVVSAELTAGTVFPSELVGGRRVFELTVIPVTRGMYEGEDFDCKRWNMTLKEITKYSNPRLHFLQPGGGVFVRGVREPGNASFAGLQPNDIILKIGEAPVRTLADARKAYETLVGNDKLPDKKVLITIQRGAFLDWIMLNWTTDFLKEE